MKPKEKKREKKSASSAYSWKALFRTLKKLHLPWGWILLALVLNLATNQLLLNLPDTTASLLGGDLSGKALMNAILFYVVYAVLAFVSVTGQVQAQAYGVRKGRQSLWQKMLGMRMAYFDRNDPSDLMSAVINDASKAVNDFVNVIVLLIPDIYYVIAALMRINQYHWVLTLSCFVLLPMKYLYALIMGKKVQVSTARVYGRVGVLTGFLADRIEHLQLIKAYTNEEKEGKMGEETANGLLKANMKIVQLDNISTGFLAVMDILQKFVVVVVAVILLQQGKIDVAMWLAFFLFAQNLFPTMDTIFDTWVKIKGIHGTFSRIMEIMEGEDEETGAAQPFPKEGDIEFKNVTFTYPDTDAPAVENVSFTIPRGSAVAVVGLCGSGKTTTVSLLERFYTPQAGSITIGGVNIGDISLKDFRRSFAYVQQGADVFGGTLREALTYGIERTVTDEEILKAAERTGFDEYIKLCKDGLDEDVASGGVSMSGGQSQRLVLTREVLRGGEIVLMDEPTSALDIRVSMKIQDTMNTVFADKTRILITHDLDFAKKYSRILVMDGGHLVGDGTHDQLLETCETYRRMNENAGEATA